MLARSLGRQSPYCILLQNKRTKTPSLSGNTWLSFPVYWNGSSQLSVRLGVVSEMDDALRLCLFHGGASVGTRELLQT